jgi:hypothetical protein
MRNIIELTMKTASFGKLLCKEKGFEEQKKGKKDAGNRK